MLQILRTLLLTGKKASAKVQISAAGTVTSVEILDGGTGYGIGNTMTISLSQQEHLQLMLLLKLLVYLITCMMVCIYLVSQILF